MVLFGAMREQLQQSNLPAAFEGTPIALISAGLMSLAFMGFQGLTPVISISVLTPRFGHCSADLCSAVAQLRKRLPQDDTSLPAEIDSLLPQTQCAQCGYPGCLPYAKRLQRCSY
ncbi:MAG: hypothetical protein CM15mP120_12470 [Pseudomonadota bacterium]|nr:MAG: hypothetical protein CM15mP120_12470 [Pseudomonadota bacterium]